MKMYLYFYQTNGMLIPGVHKGSLKNLKEKFKDSITPLRKYIRIRNNDKMALLLLEAWYKSVPVSETGLRHSLKYVIEEMERMELKCAWCYAASKT